MKINQILKVCFILFLALFLGACSNKSIDVATKNKIESIEINNNVIIPKYPFFAVKEAALEQAYSNEKASKRLALYFDRNNIDIKKIYQKELTEILFTDDYFKDKISNNGKYILTSTIKLYGLIYNLNIFSDNYKPIIILKIDLEDKETKELVWSNSCYISGLNSSTANKPFSEYINNPTDFKEALRKVVQLAIQDIIKDI